ncbi:MAG: hypothetical protein U0641_17800 [Anaerolineae bacterium]
MPPVLIPVVVLALAALVALAVVCCVPQPHLTRAWNRFVDSVAAQYRAEQTARRLLRQMLRPDEFKHIEERGYLEVASPSTAGRVYRIPYGPGRVAVYDNNRFTMSLCVQPTQWLPGGDVTLMHKLHIEANEEQYLATANHLRFA